MRKFLSRYDFYVAKFHSKAETDDENARDAQTTENIRRMRVVCDDVNMEIGLDEKILLLSAMLNYIVKPEIGVDEERFVDGLADMLRIPPEDYWNLKSFTLEIPANVVDKSRLLIINGKPEKVHPDIRCVRVGPPHKIDKHIRLQIQRREKPVPERAQARPREGLPYVAGLRLEHEPRAPCVLRPHSREIHNPP